MYWSSHHRLTETLINGLFAPRPIGSEQKQCCWLIRAIGRYELDMFQIVLKGAYIMFSRLFTKRAANQDATTIEHDALEEALRSGACIVVDVREGPGNVSD